MKKESLMLIALIASGCTQTMPIQYEALHPRGTIPTAKNLSANDMDSFINVAVYYPADGANNNYHIIPAGDYFLSRIYTGITSDHPTNIHLDFYHSVCESRGVFAPHVWCNTVANINIANKSGQHLVKVRDEFDAGGLWVAQDNGNLFTNNLTRNAAITGAASYVIDHLTAKIVEEYQKDKK